MSGFPAYRRSRLYWLAIGVPAVLFTLGGLRLVSMESERASEAEAAELRVRAEYLAESFSERLRNAACGPLEPLAQIPPGRMRHAAFRKIAGASPFVLDRYVFRNPQGRKKDPFRKGGMFRGGFRRGRAGLVEIREDWICFTDAPEPPPFFAEKGAPPGPQDASGQTRNPSNAPPAAAETGLSVWTAGPAERLLAWIRFPEGETLGIEIDPAKFLADRPALRGFCEETERTGTRAAVFAPGEERPETAESGSFAEVPLNPYLPSWTLRVARDGESPARSSLIPAGCCIIAILACSLAAGGISLARDAARQRRESLEKTGFVSNVSHELKTPLTSIKIWAELAASGRLENPERRARAMSVILSECERLSRLVENLLDFSRLEQNRRRYARTDVPLRAAAADAIAAAPRADGSPAPVLEDGPEAVASADMDAVRQILVNLLDNAGKYAPGAEISVSAGPCADGVFLRVADKGPGIPRGLEEKIFERFFRADDTVTSKTGGSGLGLSIARALARGMGGDLTAANGKDGGAVFTLVLPAAGPEEGGGAA